MANIPIGFCRYEELLNHLTALALAGGDLRTLFLVAQTTGLGPAFEEWVAEMKARRREQLTVLVIPAKAEK
jgi:hypothetical protein